MWIYDELCAAINLDGTSMPSYGIAVRAADGSEIFRFPDLTTDRALLLSLPDLLQRNQASPCHVMYVVADFLFVP
ncbi:MAG: DUF6514 family protein [Clostridiales bacterium]|jgi:hypothetical protein|nr:DUF6514 family protein [Clostridiales bacterium]